MRHLTRFVRGLSRNPGVCRQQWPTASPARVRADRARRAVFRLPRRRTRCLCLAAFHLAGKVGEEQLEWEEVGRDDAIVPGRRKLVSHAASLRSSFRMGRVPDVTASLENRSPTDGSLMLSDWVAADPNSPFLESIVTFGSSKAIHWGRARRSETRTLISRSALGALRRIRLVPIAPQSHDTKTYRIDSSHLP